MGLFLWDSEPSKIFVGDTQISKVFLWDTQVRPTVQPWQPNEHTLLYYPLTANANDASGNSRNWTAYNATFSTDDWAFLIWTQSSWNWRIESPSFKVWTVYTLNTRVKLPTALSGNHYVNLQTNWSYSPRYIQAWLWATWITVLLWNGSSSNGAAMEWSVSLWTTRHNIVMVRDGNKVTMYLDGVSLWEQTTTYSASLPQFRFGVDNWVWADYWASSYFKDYFIEDILWKSQRVSDYFRSTKRNYWIS